ncbi:ESX secretion-associated protein EspG [Rhodococcus sp. IEGM 1379]|uniref:ESX secretion-associated protein EspG n=1 Tax=Rhodococcus sp. IEGM 1379 TaxID=3047086 RepID=UPI0024B66040|nr:ESX secretion-associated protein EspG [Rhodococcus sp. IEGM 1379]MDI9918606.1 ESX secretion-associated protein EspG [Rhodococcus sp. IEGM 1379]
MTSAEIEYARDCLGLDVLPVVLGGTAFSGSTAERKESMDGAAVTLAQQGLLPGGEIHPELNTALVALTHPVQELALRRHCGGTITRVCVTQSESACIEATFNAETATYTLRGVESDPADSILRALGPCTAMQIAVVNAPTDELSIAFNAGPDIDTLVSALTNAGVPPIEAGQLGNALVDCTAFTEIVGITHALGSAHLPAGTVTVYDTALGRLVASSSLSADGTPWTSISAGTSTRLTQAVNRLVENLESSSATPSR